MFQRFLEAKLPQNTAENSPPLSANEMVTNMRNMILRSADITVKRTKIKPKTKRGASFGQPWYDNQCRAEKSKLNTAKRILHAKPYDKLSISNYLSSRKAYKKCFKKAEHQQRAQLKEKLDSVLSDNQSFTGNKNLNDETAEKGGDPTNQRWRGNRISWRVALLPWRGSV